MTILGTDGGPSPARRRAVRSVGSRIAGALALVAALVVGATVPASAIPEGGASPNTPGTWSTVSPTAVSPGSLISFTVGGFPAGETVNVKIDDGALCSDTSHGACVYYTQAIPSSGVVNGSFYLPSDLPDGDHWLRFLASAYIDPSNPSAGTKGYTLESQHFTVSSNGGSGGTSGGSTGGSSGGSTGGSSGGSSGSQSSTRTEAGGVVEAQAAEAAAEPAEVPDAPATDGDGLTGLDDGGVEAQVSSDRVVLALSEDYASEWVYVYAFSEPTGQGWQQVAVDGTVSVQTADLEAGTHRFALLDVDGALLGWAEATIAAEPTATPTPDATIAPMTSDAAAADPFPWAGVAVLVAAVVIVGAGIVVVLVRRRPGDGEKAAR